MGTSLYLEVPEEEQTVETIRQYYLHVLQRKKEVAPGRNWPSIEDDPDYERGKRHLQEGGYFYIASRVTSDIFEDLRHVGEQDPNQLSQFFRQKGTNDLVIYGETILELQALFEQLKAIDDPSKPSSREYRIETKYLALCEFASEHDYGIGLSH
ncbi:hypothetical protein [Haloprofundus salinisoli]|uniref:hypothetical protein n=1 Tax=Haloprofundus salinisoli TaxID=2876193 RepID=UPI001CCAF69C|nr:hypothetical protein [Haloprofundus salinisoli]